MMQLTTISRDGIGISLPASWWAARDRLANHCPSNQKPFLRTRFFHQISIFLKDPPFGDRFVISARISDETTNKNQKPRTEAMNNKFDELTKGRAQSIYAALKKFG